MSTEWDLECVDHRTRMGANWNHDDKELALLWRNRDALRGIADLLRQGAISLDGSYNEPNTWQVLWLVDHADCRIDLVNEYRDRKAVDTMEPLPPEHCPTCKCEPR